MKVVLFCGGLGLRLRDYSDKIPKPMALIGYRPILWHLMKYYAYYGHKDFIICLGYKADYIKNYFVKYDETISNNFIYRNGGARLELLNSDIHDWTITFVDTGICSNIGTRLKAVQPYLEGEKVFLANYSDGLTNLYLPDMIDHFNSRSAVASFMAYYSTKSYHVVRLGRNDHVESISHIGNSGLWINAGFFILRDEIFNYLEKGEELVDQPFQRLIRGNKLLAYRFTDFWTSMDTFKDQQMLDDLFAAGNPPWMVWESQDSNHKLIIEK
jgi:glucose-1-phosphate cytidylyltransferase